MTAAELATPDQVRDLEHYGYKAEKVAGWSRSKAIIVLNMERRQEQIVLLKAEAVEEIPEMSSPALRLAAAAVIEESEGDIHLLTNAVSMAVCHLSNAEVRKLAGHFVTKFRGYS